ncbi:MAG: dTDP-glucose 4,6-dehydratase [Alphaproteobacteria bacterium]|nr:dTDP-glucose 4,6-dehydratase [Alphaproteobacteria bacterium]
MRILVTGGAGFIGSALVRRLIGTTPAEVLNVDALSCTGNLANVADVARSSRYAFMQADIGDARAMAGVLERFTPDRIFHLAAETQVDRSIDDPLAFIQTNAIGTATLLQVAQTYWQRLSPAAREGFRLIHVSSDEVFGSIEPSERPTEATPWNPNSPYAASKAASDHFVRAWHRTYGLPTIVTHASNNYGPYQFPEKLIPLAILNALEGKPVRLYGSGLQERDWLHVDDHVDALLHIAQNARPGSSHVIGGRSPRRNCDVVAAICGVLDRLVPESAHKPHATLVEAVADRPGHDARHAVDDARLAAELGWTPRIGFEEGLLRTVAWYIANRRWWIGARTRLHDGERLGLARAG